MSDGITVDNRSGDSHPDNVLKTLRNQITILSKTNTIMHKALERLSKAKAHGPRVKYWEIAQKALDEASL